MEHPGVDETGAGPLTWLETFALRSYSISGALLAPFLTFALTPGVSQWWVSVVVLFFAGQFMAPAILRRADKSSSDVSLDKNDAAHEFLEKRRRFLFFQVVIVVAMGFMKIAEVDSSWLARAGGATAALVGLRVPDRSELETLLRTSHTTG